jgi:hypothetical protein
LVAATLHISRGIQRAHDGKKLKIGIDGNRWAGFTRRGRGGSFGPGRRLRMCGRDHSHQQNGQETCAAKPANTNFQPQSVIQSVLEFTNLQGPANSVKKPYYL